MLMEHGLIKVADAYQETIPETAHLYVNVAGVMCTIKKIYLKKSGLFKLTIITPNGRRSLEAREDTALVISYADLAGESTEFVYLNSRVAWLPLSQSKTVGQLELADKNYAGIHCG